MNLSNVLGNCVNVRRKQSLLWNALRARRLCDLKFRRQHPISPFFADFACLEYKFIVEIDGGYHDYRYDDDVKRQKYLEEKGWRIIRYSNEDVIQDVNAVTKSIAKEIGLEWTVGDRKSVRSGMRSGRPK